MTKDELDAIRARSRERVYLGGRHAGRSLLIEAQTDRVKLLAHIEELERDIAQVTKDADGYARDVIRLHGRIEGLETAVADALRAPSDRGVK